jgi:hypothetical protein
MVVEQRRGSSHNYTVTVKTEQRSIVILNN